MDKLSPSKTMGMHFLKRGKLHPPLFLGANSLHFVQNAKYLDLMFDSRLTGVLHIKQIKVKVTKALSILLVLSLLSWGADRTSLLWLYRALICSKLDYRCEAYSHASPSSLDAGLSS